MTIYDQLHHAIFDGVDNMCTEESSNIELLPIELLGYSLNDVMRANVFKLQSRYPNGFESEKSLDRKDGDV